MFLYRRQNNSRKEGTFMPRKGENIYKRKDGRWEARYIKSHDISGRAKYGYVYGKSYREAKQKQHNALAKLEDSLDTGNNQVVLYKSDVKALSVYWLTSIEPQIKQSTFNKYNNLLASYIVPYLGDIEINDLAVDKLYEWCNYLLQKGGKKENGISPKTVSDALSLIRRIICHAASRGYKTLCTGKELSINQPSKEINVLTRSEQDALCRYLYKHPCERNIGILLSLFTGLRIGELCALDWPDISLESGTIYIHKNIQRVQTKENSEKKTEIVITKPKSQCSIRTIPIPEFLISFLKNADIKRQGYLLTGNNKYLEPRTMENHFHKILDEISIRQVNFHTLRHTFATRCIEVGFDIKSLSEILGHANVNITLNRYVHPPLQLKKENMERLSVFAVK